VKYIYTANGCPACIDLKHAYDLQGVKYEERSAQRLKEGKRIDQVDIDAFVQLNMQNMELPVEVNTEHFSDYLSDKEKVS
jgi:glutaredoxin